VAVLEYAQKLTLQLQHRLTDADITFQQLVEDNR
jgi:hypothetical protein